MNLLKLKEKVDLAINHAIECGENPEEIKVSLQIDGPSTCSLYSDEDVELHYDNNVMTSGCVLIGLKPSIKCEDCGSESTETERSYSHTCGKCNWTWKTTYE